MNKKQNLLGLLLMGYLVVGFTKSPINLEKAAEPTTNEYWTDSWSFFDSYSPDRMGDTISDKNHQNNSQNQPISPFRDDSIATSRIKKTKVSTASKPVHLNLEAMGSYNNFRFNSNTSGGYNKFRGHSYLYMVGGHDTQISDNWLAGLFYYNANVSLTSDVLLLPGTPVNTHETIHNNNLMAHLLHHITPHWYMDLLGSYGQSKMNYFSNIPTSSEGGELIQGNAIGHGNNWFASLTGGYVGNKNNFLIRTYVSVLYSQINQQSFGFNFPVTSSVNNVPSLTNNSTYLLEHLEITYTKSQYIQPFVSSGLIEVLQFANNRSIINNIVLVGALPEFNLNQNGFRAGGGINLNYKKWILRLEQNYNQRGSVYRNNQSLVTLIFILS